MSVLVQTLDGWEQVEDARKIEVTDAGALRCIGMEPGYSMPTFTEAVYAPGSWLYAEVEP